MALSFKERFARLDMSKLPGSYKAEFDEMSKETYGFTDEDLNDIFAENFNDLYELVEKKYPDAIKTGGVVKKEKPAKVKVVKKKKDIGISQSQPDFIPGVSNLKKKLSEDDIEFIESTLRNDEASSDAEMVDHFVEELGITKTKAEKWVKLRSKYLAAPVEKSISYKERTKLKKEARKEKDVVKTRDGHEFNRKDPKNRGKKFFDENGKEWTCKKYEPKIDECIFEDSEGKQISSCIRDMYVSNPVKKRAKGDLIDECRETLKEAGYTIKEHKAGKKKIKRKEPRPEKEIIKERVQDTFTPIVKDLGNSEEKKKENKEVIESLDRIQKLFVKLFNRLSNLADDGKKSAIDKIEKLLNELLNE